MKKLALLALSVVGAGAHAIVLDGFVDGSYNSGYMTTGSAIAWTNATVVGGIRGTYIGIISNPDDEDARARVRGLVSGGSYSVSAGPGVSVFAQLAYGYAVGNNTTGGNDLNLDLTASNKIRLNFNSNDLDLDTTIQLISNGSTVGSQNALIGASGSAFSQTFTFGGSIADVDQIIIGFANTPSGDFSLNSVEAVPEPASMAILGLGIAAMARRRNRK